MRMIIRVWIIGIYFMASLAASQTCGPPVDVKCSAPTPCCSNSSACGNTTAHCGVGCLSQHSAPGACFSREKATTIAAVVTRCGRDPTKNSTTTRGSCLIREYCCSPFGYCGIGDDYCIGCQKDFGRCPPLCDGSRLCGPYGIAAFAISIISLIISCFSMICLACTRN